MSPLASRFQVPEDVPEELMNQAWAKYQIYQIESQTEEGLRASEAFVKIQFLCGWNWVKNVVIPEMGATLPSDDVIEKVAFQQPRPPIPLADHDIVGIFKQGAEACIEAAQD